MPCGKGKKMMMDKPMKSMKGGGKGKKKMKKGKK
jgi:hypothetical protein